MKKVLFFAALLYGGVSALAAQSAPRPASGHAPVSSSKPSVSVIADAHADAAKHRDWLNKNCVGCHSNKVKQPAEDPINLEAASVDDVVSSAATWERVLRKLAVRAMPPQSAPRHPSEPEYVAFTTWLSNALDRGWAGKATPGRFVVHRLNRTEYGNAVRDLLALDVNINGLLPSDGADFGFDNIASSLKTSPL